MPSYDATTNHSYDTGVCKRKHPLGQDACTACISMHFTLTIVQTHKQVSETRSSRLDRRARRGSPG